MNKEQIEYFRFGYGEARAVSRLMIRDLLEKKVGLRKALRQLLEAMEHEESEETFKNAQEMIPGLTRDEYEDEMKRSAEAIKSRYYRKDGRLKMHLIKK